MALQEGKVLSAVYRVGPHKTSTGTPMGYALRLLVEPKPNSAESSASRLRPRDWPSRTRSRPPSSSNSVRAR